MVSNTRLYGAAIAIAAGGYSLWTGATTPRTGAAGVVVLLVGVVVLVHGVLLLTGAAERLAGASGPLMVAYAVVVLVLQALLAAGVLGGMAGGMGGPMMDGSTMRGTTADAGLVVLALLLLVSGLVIYRDGMDDGAARERM